MTRQDEPTVDRSSFRIQIPCVWMAAFDEIYGNVRVAAALSDPILPSSLLRASFFQVKCNCSLQWLSAIHFSMQLCSECSLVTLTLFRAKRVLQFKNKNSILSNSHQLAISYWRKVQSNAESSKVHSTFFSTIFFFLLKFNMLAGFESLVLEGLRSFANASHLTELYGVLYFSSIESLSIGLKAPRSLSCCWAALKTSKSSCLYVCIMKNPSLIEERSEYWIYSMSFLCSFQVCESQILFNFFREVKNALAVGKKSVFLKIVYKVVGSNGKSISSFSSFKQFDSNKYKKNTNISNNEGTCAGGNWIGKWKIRNYEKKRR